jgi:uncharacterized protein
MSRLLAVVTGASAGIGTEFAEQLAARGYDLLLVARREERLDSLGRLLSERYSIRSESYVADLANEEHVTQLASRLRNEPQLGFLVNNAGFGSTGLFWEASLESQEAMHRVHVMATMRLSHAALGVMVARNEGAVINVSSLAGFSLSAGDCSYCSTKAWMTSFTEGLAVDLRSAGSAVQAQALCPGFTLTEFHDVLGMNRGRIPAGLWLKPEQVVNAAFRGLARGKVVVVPGIAYKAARFLIWFLPPGARRAVAVVSGRAKGRDKLAAPEPRVISGA